MSAELGKYQVKIGQLDGKLKFELPRTLSSIERIISLQIHTALKKTIMEWEPDISWGRRLRMAVPQAAADFFDADNLGKDAVQAELKQVWESELKYRFKQHLDTNSITSLAADEIKGMVHQISLYFRSEFIDASPELKEKLMEREKAQTKNKSIDINNSTFSITDSIETAVRKVEDQVTSSLINLITVDALLAATLGAILTPLGSLALMVARRLWQGNREKQRVKGAIEDTVHQVAQEIAAKIRLEIETTINDAITTMTDMYISALSLEMESVLVPIRIIDEAINDIKEYKVALEKLQFE